MYDKLLVAHRGYQKAFPENTLLAYRSAIAEGAQSIETDVMLSADKQAVLYHDATLKRVSKRSGRVDQHLLEELITLPAYEPRRFGNRYIEETITPLSSLVNLLLEYPHITAYIEIKEEALAFAGLEQTYEVVSQCLASVRAQCVLISFHYDFILLAHTQGWQQCGVVLKHWNDLNSELIQRIQPQVVFVDYKKIPASAELNRLGHELVVYEIAETKLALNWLKRGAHKIETFDIKGLIKQLSTVPS